MQARPNDSSNLAGLKKIGRYRIVRPLSKGGMAVVYEARRESLAGVSPKVAIKLILPEHSHSETFRDLFINEARLGAAMQHQNLVQIQAFEEEGDQYFLVMEYVEGLTLRRVISLGARHDAPVPLRVIAEIGRQACEGLHYAHQATDEHGAALTLVHRDIKPSNLILNPQGVVKVLDFGISKGRLREEKKGSVKGTWGYMAPEQAFGRDVGPRADVFGLAVVLYELASRRPMFRGKKRDEIKRLLQDDHAARMCATLEVEYRDLIGVLVRALQRDPQARYTSAEAFGRALSSLLPDPVTARDETVAHFNIVNALYNGHPVPASSARQSVPNFSGSVPGSVGGSAPGSQDSIARSQGTTADDAFSIWIAAGVFGSIVGVTLLLGAVIIALGGWSALQSRPNGTPVAPTPPEPVLAADEPAGPAGEGAPGDTRPPPAERGAPEPEKEPEPQPETAPEPQPDSARVKVVRPRPKPVPAPEAVPRPSPVVVPAPIPDPAPAPEPEPVDPGVMMIGSIQTGSEVYVDGKFVRQVPVRRELGAGSYVVSIVAPDGRRKSFRVELEAGETERRVWDFDRGTWR